MTHDEHDAPGDWTTRVTRDVAPPPQVRTRVADGLRAQGLLPARHRGRWQGALRAAAALMVFAAGWMAASLLEREPGVAGPRYMFLLSGAPSEPADMAARVREYRDWAARTSKDGAHVSGERLDDEAVTVGAATGDAGRVGGFFIVAAPTVEAARALAAEHPHVRHGGTIEIRRISGS